MTNNKNRRGARPAATPAIPAELPPEKITPRSEADQPTTPTTQVTPPASPTAAAGVTIDPLTGRPIRDLRAVRAAERAARMARGGSESNTEAQAEATPATTTQPAPTEQASAKPKRTPRARTPRAAAAPPADTTATPPPAQAAERITPKATTPTPPPTERTTPAATIMPPVAQLPPERITPKPATTLTPRPPAQRSTSRAASQPTPQLPPERISHASNQPEAAVPTRIAPPTQLPTERITTSRSAAATPTPPPASSSNRPGHRTATSHSNPTLRTLPGERITPRRNDRRSDGNGEDSGYELHTYSASEMRQDELEKQAAERLHPGMYWYRMDLHCHTPRSTVCYREANATMLRIIQKAEERGVDILAITDHNTVAGYGDLVRDREHVERMDVEGRLTAEERYRLNEYRRIFGKMLILPGFEFSATFGFHILCIFPPNMSIRRMEHLLMSMGITEEKMLLGSPEVGATTDVLNVYRLVAAESGICIGAHANSSNGIVMNGFNFGGQTKIAYTQDPNLAALEVTDLDSVSRRSTPNFFNGSKPEYPRRMHCIQSSDSHRIYRDPDEKQRILGVGDRTTEVLLTELSFAAMRELFTSSDWERVRPTRRGEEPVFDAVKSARAVGPNLVQAFHDRLPMRRMSSHHILRDIAAFANTNGGTIYLGVPPLANQPLRGVDNATEAIDVLRGEISRNITPALSVGMDVRTSEGKTVVLVNVPKGTDRPYALDGSQIYIRQESETNLAMRDEIVQLIREVVAGSTGDTIFAARPATAALPTGEPTTPQPTIVVGEEERHAAQREAARLEEQHRFERRAERRDRYQQQREPQAASLPQLPIATTDVDAVATPPTSISQPAPQVEPALVALAAPSLAAATIAAEPIDSQVSQPEEQTQEAIGDEPPLSISARRRARRRRKSSPTDIGTDAAITDELSSMELGEPMGSETAAEGGPDYITDPPRTGVEIVATEGSGNNLYHTMKDLRNGNLVHHVSRHSARRLWRYAITQREHNEPRPEDITWLGDIGIWRSTVRADLRRYDLAQRDAQGNFHAYYGVTEDGLHGPWLAFTAMTPTVETDDEETTAAPSTPEPAAAPSIRFADPTQDFADLLEEYFNQMDDPYQRAIVVSSYGHAPAIRLPRRELTTPLDEAMIPAQDEMLAAPSVFDGAMHITEEVAAYTAADESVFVEEIIEVPNYLALDEVSEVIVVIDSTSEPEAAAISDDGSGPSLAEAREAWTAALTEPQRRPRTRRPRRTDAAQAEPITRDTQSEPTADTARAQAEPLTETSAIDIEPAAAQATANLSKSSRGRAPRIRGSRGASTNSGEAVSIATSGEVPSVAAAPNDEAASNTAAISEAATKLINRSRTRNRHPQTDAQATNQENGATESQTQPEPIAPTAPTATPARPRLRVTRNDLRRGRDEDPNNPDTAPIPALSDNDE